MKVFIIVPVYNVENYLSRCLDSLVNQTYNDYLIICVNDGSTDNSLSILNEYKKKYPNKFKIISKKNGGLASARNAGLDAVSDFNNSLLTFVDSDDYVSNDFLKTLVEKYLETDVDIVCSTYFVVNPDGDIEFKKESENEFLSSFEACCELFDGKIQSHSQTKLYSSQLWINKRFDEKLRFMEDQAMTFQIFLEGNKIFRFNWSGYYLCLREGSLCQSKMTNNKIINALTSYLINYNFDYVQFDDFQKNLIRTKVLNLFANVFLMMYPRFNRKIATADELNEWKKIIDFEKNNKVVKRFKATNNKEKIKKIVFLYLKPLYRFLFRFFLKKYDS